MAEDEEINSKSENCSQIQVTFFTKQKAYSVPPTPFSLPSNVGCEKLSSLINSILQQENILNAENQVDFDFLIHGQYIADTLKNHISTENLSTETVLEIEYIEKQGSPWPEKMMLQNDWVSSIAVTNDCILSGSYDNFVYMWDLNGNCLNSVSEHTSAVKSVEWIQKDKDKVVFLSSSLDQTIKICEWLPHDERTHCLYICKGHSKSVDCLAVHPSLRQFCSGSWDKTLKLWSSDLTTLDNDAEKQGNLEKKTKTEGLCKASLTRTPLMTLTGHNEAVSSVLWSNDKEMVSCSWDHTIRVWDAESGVNKHTLTGGKAINGISYSPYCQLIASASADRHVRLWDHRTKDGAVFQQTLTSHNGWVSSVCWSPSNQFMLVSGSYDHTVILWDTRSPNKPLHVLTGHNNQVMCVNWTMEQFVMSGGSDNQLIIHRISGEEDEMNGNTATT